VDGKKLELGSAGRKGTSDLLKNLEKRYGVKTLGFFIADGSHQWRGKLEHVYFEKNPEAYYLDDDFKKAQIGIASTGFEGNPCNMHLNDLALQIKKSISDEDLVGLIFNTIGVSDGITNGTKGMTYSLISREIIADSIETIVNAQFYDGLISVVGCDKNMPGAMMAIGRLNRPSILVYGGTIKSGKYKDKSLNIVSAFEAYGQKIKGKISEEEYKGIIKNSIPGPGACGGMYTANTMSSAIEALGMSLPFSSSNPAESNNKLSETQTIGKSIYNLLKEDIRPKDIMTRKAFENALSIIMVLGGSTNAVLHIIAMANSVGVEVSLDDFQNFSNICFKNINIINLVTNN